MYNGLVSQQHVIRAYFESLSDIINMFERDRKADQALCEILKLVDKKSKTNVVSKAVIYSDGSDTSLLADFPELWLWF